MFGSVLIYLPVDVPPDITILLSNTPPLVITTQRFIFAAELYVHLFAKVFTVQLTKGIRVVSVFDPQWIVGEVTVTIGLPTAEFGIRNLQIEK